MASAYLTRTPSSTSSTTITTHSLWFKRSEFENDFLYINFENGTNYGYIGFDSDSLDVRSSPGYVYVSTQKLRDPSAWYHLVVAVDNSIGTASDRVKIYLNGSRITSFSTQTDPTSGAVNNLSVDNTTSNLMNVGGYSGGNYFGGSIAHFHFIDGTAYPASTFGESDSNGVWIPKPSPSVTYGTNGFFLKFDNSGNMGLDSSGQSNNLTTSGTITQAKDTPSNVFATMNALDNFYANATLSNGNTTVATNASNETYITSTLAVSTGKYYWEVEYDAGSDNSFIGIIDRVSDSTSFQAYIDATNGISYKKNGSIYTNGGNMSGVNIGTYTTGDIISVAMDLDNNKLYFGKNGSWLNSGVPTSGSTGTGAFSINSSPKDGVYYAQVGDDNSGSQTLKCNFGNGYFGTTAVTSAGTNASGNGIFEYDVPTGYTALSTKGLNE